jgi:hypothetical protein
MGIENFEQKNSDQIKSTQIHPILNELYFVNN